MFIGLRAVSRDFTRVTHTCVFSTNFVVMVFHFRNKQNTRVKVCLGLPDEILKEVYTPIPWGFQNRK